MIGQYHMKSFDTIHIPGPRPPEILRTGTLSICIFRELQILARIPRAQALVCIPITFSLCQEEILTWWVFVGRLVKNSIIAFSLKKKKILLLFKEGKKGGRKRGRETSMCGCLLSAPYWGPGL